MITKNVNVQSAESGQEKIVNVRITIVRLDPMVLHSSLFQGKKLVLTKHTSQQPGSISNTMQWLILGVHFSLLFHTQIQHSKYNINILVYKQKRHAGPLPKKNFPLPVLNHRSISNITRATSEFHHTISFVSNRKIVIFVFVLGIFKTQFQVQFRFPERNVSIRKKQRKYWNR